MFLRNITYWTGFELLPLLWPLLKKTQQTLTRRIRIIASRLQSDSTARSHGTSWGEQTKLSTNLAKLQLQAPSTASLISLSKCTKDGHENP